MKNHIRNIAPNGQIAELWALIKSMTKTMTLFGCAFSLRFIFDTQGIPEPYLSIASILGSYPILLLAVKNSKGGSILYNMLRPADYKKEFRPLLAKEIQNVKRKYPAVGKIIDDNKMVFDVKNGLNTNNIALLNGRTKTTLVDVKAFAKDYPAAEIPKIFAHEAAHYEQNRKLPFMKQVPFFARFGRRVSKLFGVDLAKVIQYQSIFRLFQEVDAHAKELILLHPKKYATQAARDKLFMRVLVDCNHSVLSAASKIKPNAPYPNDKHAHRRITNIVDRMIGRDDRFGYSRKMMERVCSPEFIKGYVDTQEIRRERKAQSPVVSPFWLKDISILPPGLTGEAVGFIGPDGILRIMQIIRPASQRG
ncbi:MAG: hypothetical protein FWD15_02045 [Alphaproteobacteria bacterium]|nr:hypothetical protein [Alphaproteobacteria bacterium]